MLERRRTQRGYQDHGRHHGSEYTAVELELSGIDRAAVARFMNRIPGLAG